MWHATLFILIKGAFLNFERIASLQISSIRAVNLYRCLSSGINNFLKTKPQGMFDYMISLEVIFGGGREIDLRMRKLLTYSG